MQMNRRSFLGSAFAAGAAVAMPGCCSCCCGQKVGQIALQLYSLKDYIGGKKNVGLEKTLAEVAALGFKGEVPFNIRVYDNDGKGFDGWMEYAPIDEAECPALLKL